LVCLRLKGNWSFVESIDLPLVLRLSRPPDGHVLLVGLDDQEVLLRHDGQDWRVPRLQLDRRWRGDLLVAWPDSGEVFKRGDSGAAIRRMKTLASRADPVPWTGAIDADYD